MKARFVPTAVVLVLCAVFIGTWIADRDSRAEAKRRELDVVAEQVAKRLHDFFYFRLQVLLQLEDHYLSQEDRSAALFRRLSADSQRRFPGFQAINWIDAQGVIRIPVPLGDNRAILDEDLMKHPVAGKLLKRVFKNQTVEHTGAIDLIQGQVGFACYIPVHVDGKVVGVINGVFRFQKVMDACLEQDNGSLHSFQLIADDRVVARFGALGDRVFGDQASLSPVYFGSDRWTLAAVRNDVLVGEGASTFGRLILALGVTLALALGVLIRHLYLSRERLRLSEAKTEQILSTATEGVWAVNQHGDIVYANQQLAKLLESSPQELEGKNFLELVFEADRQVARERFVRRSQGVAETFDARFRRLDGKEVWAHLSVTPTFDAAGNFSGALAMTSDLTEKRDLEERLRQSQKMDALGRLAGGIAHDFNNVLTTIIGASELIELEGKTNASQEKLIVEIQEGAARAARMVAQLLAFSRKKVSKKEPLDLVQVVDGMTMLLKRLVGDGVDLRIAFAPGMPRINADRSQMEQVFLNLAVNAKDAMGRKGVLEFSGRVVDSADSQTRCVELSVADSGPGIDPSLRDVIFEPFFTTKEVGQGTGLGLATVHGILKNAGADIVVKNSPHGGAAFVISFPDLSEAAEAES